MRPPDGIPVEETWGTKWQARHASPLSLLVLGAIITAAFTGPLGAPEADRRTDTDEVALAVHTPTLIRNGELFEMRMRVRARRAVGRLAVAVDAGLWEDMTVNTLLPAAAEESFEDGAFVFSFGELAAGDSLVMKVDLQINPDILGGNEGRIRIYDGERLLAALPVRIGVLP